MKRNRKYLSILLAVVMLAGIGCKKNLHPGAVSVVDSNIYDTLLVAQAALDEGRKTIAENPDPSYKVIFNKTVAVYNQAEADWQLYHSTGDPALGNKLQVEISDVITTTAQLRTALGKKVGK